MATGGRVLHHLKAFAPDARNSILFAGFQAAGTRGAAIVAGAPTVRIHGQHVPDPRRGRPASTRSRRHADRDELLAWVGALPAAPQARVRHPRRAAALRCAAPGDRRAPGLALHACPSTATRSSCDAAMNGSMHAWPSACAPRADRHLPGAGGLHAQRLRGLPLGGLRGAGAGASWCSTAAACIATLQRRRRRLAGARRGGAVRGRLAAARRCKAARRCRCAIRGRWSRSAPCAPRSTAAARRPPRCARVIDDVGAGRYVRPAARGLRHRLRRRPARLERRPSR